MMKNFKIVQRLFAFTVLLTGLWFSGCGEIDSRPPSAEIENYDLFQNSDAEVNVEEHLITLPKVQDSLFIESLAELGGSSYYLALDGDLNDPAIDWDNPLETGSVIKKGESGFDNIVVMDEKDRIIAVWKIKNPKQSSSSSKKSSSSSVEEKSSSSVSEKDSLEVASSSSRDNPADSVDANVSCSSAEESSSSVEPEATSSSEDVVASSSSEAQASCSSVESESSSSADVPLESSSSVVESSSSVPESSSSVEPEPESSSSEETVISSSSESAPQVLKASDLSIPGGVITVDEGKVYVEMPYGSDLSKLKFDQLDTTCDLVRPVEMVLGDDLGSLKTYSVVAGVQLPGSDFSERVDSFWGTTSDAMAKNASSSGVTMASTKNAEFESSMLTLTSQVIGGTALFITAGHKLAAGVYFAGLFKGTNCNDLYNADGGYPGLEESDFSLKMDMGRSFSARPESFDITFAYEHVKGKSKNYPQKALVYVLLADDDNKVVAVGSLVLEESSSMGTVNVPMFYGTDPDQILNSKFAIPSGLTLGDGSETVSKIYVMFSSSAYGHVAATDYRGGEGSKLTIDNFKLNY